jgi:hypothetical protein
MNFFGQHIEFNNPEMLSGGWLGLTLVFVAVVCAFGFLSLLALRNSYANKENLDRTTRALSFAGAAAKAVIIGLIGVLLCIAAADPFEPNSATVVPEGTLQIAAAFDVSPSMGAEDYRDVLPTETGPDGSRIMPTGPWGSRLMVAKWLFVNQVMKQLPGNEIALATFTADPWPQWPVADDYGTIRFILTDTGWMGIGSAPGGGSDFIQGLKMGIRQLKLNYDPVSGKLLYDPNKRHVIFLFTDGGLEFEDEREKAGWEKEYAATVAEAKAMKAEVIIVGIGSDTPQLVPIYHPFTMERIDWWPFRKDPKEKTKLDEEQLIKLRDRLVASGLDARYKRIPTEGEASLNVDWIGTVGGTKVSQGKRSLLQYPLLGAIGLFVLLIGRGLWTRNHAAPTRPRIPR